MSEIEHRLSMDDSMTPEEWELHPVLWNEDSFARYQHTYLRGGWEAPMNWYWAFFLNFEDEKRFLTDPRIHVPFVTILAEHGPAVPTESGDMSKPLLPNRKLVIMPCGHWVRQEDGPGLGRTITEWLESLG